MAVANDSITVTPGSGATVATHLIGGKEHQAVVLADASGHVVSSRDLYMFQTGASVLAQNKHHLTLFNGSGSGVVLKIKSIIAQKNMATVTGVAFEMNLNWITAAGTGGTALTGYRLDQTNPALPAQVTATNNPTTPTEAATTFQFIRWLHSEETNVAAQVQEAFPIWPPNPMMADWAIQDLTLREGQGITLKQITSTTAGTYYWAVIFTTE